MPSSASAENNPRALGSAANCPRKGCASMVWSSRRPSSARSRNSSPFLSKNGDASGRRTVRKCAVSAASAASSPAAVASASSGLAASITATSRSKFCGNRRFSSASLRFQGRVASNSPFRSVVTLSRPAARAAHTAPSTNPASTTKPARLAQNSTRRASRSARRMAVVSPVCRRAATPFTRLFRSE